MTLQNDDDSALPAELRAARFEKKDIYDAPEWYDVDYAGYRGEEAFYRLVLQKSVKPGGAVVELGAGTGRLLMRFQSEGFLMHAVEPAPVMRAELEKKAGIAVEDALAATFRGPAGVKGARIDVVIFPFNGLLHLRTREEMRASFRHIHERLDDDGRFALDCTGPYWEAMMYAPSAWGRSDERVHHKNGRTVLTCDRCSYDASTRQMRIDIRYLLEGATEGIEIALHQTMWTWQEVLGALEESGFEIDLVFGDVDMAPFDEGSPRLLVSVKKRRPG